MRRRDFIMSWKTVWLALVLVPLATSLAGLEAAHAQTMTPGKIIKWADDLSLTDSAITEDQKTGNVGIGTDKPTTNLDVAGTTRTNVLQITGGADLSERFELSQATSKIEPGMVVAIDPRNPGKLLVSTKAYDRRVAGILSGAGGVQPGMLMGQAGTLADGGHPVALTGRVYVRADASTGPIRPGDLLTTSDTPGHAMAVKDFTRAQGAILGKAMTGLQEGKGLVLVLVALQ